jgi:hypothetical protein
MNLNKTTIDWLLEEDNPDVRYLTLRNIIKLKENDSVLIEARKKAISEGMIAKILKRIKPEGYWVKPGAGYGPKYKSIVWSLITLSQLGAKITDDHRIEKACKYYLKHVYNEGGYLGYSGLHHTAISCLQGNMCVALYDLGVQDFRLDEAYDLLARSVTGEGMSPTKDKKSMLRFTYYMCGPGFLCIANDKLPCSWGAVKVMLALSKLPVSKRTKIVENAIKTGVDFLLKYDPVKANYPTRDNTKPNRSWFKFGFPVFYVTDVLQNVEVLINLGFGDHPKVKKAIDFILQKQDTDNRWNLEYNYNGKTWGNWGEPGKPSKWVTYRVYNVLNNLKIKN